MASLQGPKIHKAAICKQKFFCTLIGSFISVAKAENIASNYKDKERKTCNTETTVESVIVEADELFLIGKFKESYTILLEYKVRIVFLSNQVIVYAIVYHCLIQVILPY